MSVRRGGGSGRGAKSCVKEINKVLDSLVWELFRVIVICFSISQVLLVSAFYSINFNEHDDQWGFDEFIFIQGSCYLILFMDLLVNLLVKGF